MRSDADGLTTSDIIEFLGGRSVLLYLDTCEHVIESVAEFVDQAVAVVPQPRVLATTREPLRPATSGSSTSCR